MDGMLLMIIVPLVVFGTLALLAWHVGVDSRPGSTDPRSPVHDLSV